MTDVRHIFDSYFGFTAANIGVFFYTRNIFIYFFSFLYKKTYFLQFLSYFYVSLRYETDLFITFCRFCSLFADFLSPEDSS